MNGQIVVVTTA